MSGEEQLISWRSRVHYFFRLLYDPEELGFLDETSKNEKTAARSRGRAQKGQRAVMQQRFIRGHRLSATALLTVNGISVTRVVEGSMTRAMYLNFLEHEVVRFFWLL